MRNGYALCTRDGLDAIAAYITALPAEGLDALRGKLRVGAHWDVEVTDVDGPIRPTVSQCFCSALPVAYSRVPPNHWEAFETMILEAAYEATLLASAAIAQRGGSNVVFLTRLGAVHSETRMRGSTPRCGGCFEQLPIVPSMFASSATEHLRVNCSSSHGRCDEAGSRHDSSEGSKPD